MDSSFSASARSHGMDPKRRRSGAEQEQPGLSTLRCAIYTRKSTEEGLTQEFNTLEAQRESAEAFVHSQLHAGWTVLAERYDDGGYTGANLERPALRRLLADIAADRIDCVLVYKVDSLCIFDVEKTPFNRFSTLLTNIRTMNYALNYNLADQAR